MDKISSLEIVVVGLSHKTASIDKREKIAFSTDEIDSTLKLMKKRTFFRECIIFSTCNRVESIFVSEIPDEAVENMYEIFAEVKAISLDEFIDNFYVYTGKKAVRHVLRVASSLDSMIIGEPQIIGQVKSAYKCATSAGSSGVILNRMFHRAFHAAKRVRTETGIGCNAVSISYAAVELARKKFGALDNKKVLLIGAGEMAELAVEHLIHHHVSSVYVANRTFKKGVELANRFSGSGIRFEDIGKNLELVDIIISSTGASDYIILKDEISHIINKRDNRPLFFIDIAVPRDIDPELKNVDNIYVYDLDDLQEVVDLNVKGRIKESDYAEKIIEEMAENFISWKENLQLVPTIVELRAKVKNIVEREVKKTMKDNNMENFFEKKAVSKMVDAICSRLLHDPINFLKDPGAHRDMKRYLSFARTLFGLDTSKIN
ncbi:MAG: glutamyl-tRNA reductase [Deltaproteobacteria bacterium]|nr:MAG: glutamyl-tRNA reductase [Deltaproteobacteria bacterium]PIE74991.1 MAG: glutamyl-tRNA reductase [Deltaproteobacteria bacterium]